MADRAGNKPILGIGADCDGCFDVFSAKFQEHLQRAIDGGSALQKVLEDYDSDCLTLSSLTRIITNLRTEEEIAQVIALISELMLTRLGVQIEVTIDKPLNTRNIARAIGKEIIDATLSAIKTAERKLLAARQDLRTAKTEEEHTAAEQRVAAAQARLKAAQEFKLYKSFIEEVKMTAANNIAIMRRKARALQKFLAHRISQSSSAILMSVSNRQFVTADRAMGLGNNNGMFFIILEELRIRMNKETSTTAGLNYFADCTIEYLTAYALDITIPENSPPRFEEYLASFDFNGHTLEEPIYRKAAEAYWLGMIVSHHNLPPSNYKENNITRFIGDRNANKEFVINMLTPMAMLHMGESEEYCRAQVGYAMQHDFRLIHELAGYAIKIQAAKNMIVGLRAQSTMDGKPDAEIAALFIDDRQDILEVVKRYFLSTEGQNFLQKHNATLELIQFSSLSSTRDFACCTVRKDSTEAERIAYQGSLDEFLANEPYEYKDHPFNEGDTPEDYNRVLCDQYGLYPPIVFDDDIPPPPPPPEEEETQGPGLYFSQDRSTHRRGPSLVEVAIPPPSTPPPATQTPVR